SQLDNLLTSLARDERAKQEERSLEARGHVSDSTLRFDYSPFDEVSDFLQANQNHFPVLEEAAEAIRQDFRLERRVLSDQLIRVLGERLGIRVEVSEELSTSSVVRRFDAENQVLAISSALVEQRRKFDLAHFIGLRLLDDPRLSESI